MTERDLTAVKPVLKTISELTDIVSAADLVCKRIENRVQQFRDFVNARSAEISHRKVPGLTTAEQQRVNAASLTEATSVKKAETIAANDEDTKKKLGPAKHALEAAAVFYADAASVLERRTLSSAKRATYTANLANAGSAAVRTAALTAVATGDEELAAAVVQKLGNLPAGDRPFAPGSFIVEFGVDDYHKYQTLKAYFDRRLSEALLESRFVSLGFARHAADKSRAKIERAFNPAPSRADALGEDDEG
jgi:hypothetical protein